MNKNNERFSPSTIVSLYCARDAMASVERIVNSAIDSAEYYEPHAAEFLQAAKLRVKCLEDALYWLTKSVEEDMEEKETNEGD